MTATASRPNPGRTWLLIRGLLMGALTVATSLGILVISTGPVGGQVTLQVGDVSAIDVIAPRSITYISQVQTNAAREAAEAAVPDVYDPPDSRVTRQQVTRLQQVLDYIGSVRGDAFASLDQKLTALGAITELAIDDDLGRALLELSEAEWTAVRGEAVTVIERVMSSRVRADRVEDARNQVPALVSVSLSEEQAAVVARLASPFITANSFFNEAATNTARQAAREAVAPISQSFVQGQTVITRGRVITNADAEAATALGLLQTDLQWQVVTAQTLTVLLAFTLFGAFLLRFHRDFFLNLRLMIFVAILLSLFALGARVVMPGRAVLPFIFPSAALAMLTSVTLGPAMGVIISVTYAALVGVVVDGNPEVIAYMAVGGAVAAMALGRAERINSFFWAGVSSALANIVVILIFRLPDPTADLIGIVTLIAASGANGALSAGATIAILFLLGNIFDIYTPLQLTEYARPNHPLLQFMLRQAPGTYQHSLQVANLAEQAAERVGANTALIRVGAMFHDVGKSLHPEYFVENQIEGENPHDGLPPDVSAQVVIDHVHDGLKMAAKHRLPRVIRECIAEHHGTNLTFFQYQRALQAAGGDENAVDKARFRYPGPKPQSRETAILMLADGCEAKSRADRPHNEEEIDRIVRYIIDRSLSAQQLDECNLTLHDLKLVRESFKETLRSFFHARLTYPEEKLPVVTEAEEVMRR